jgi:alcohol oxidase
MICPDSEFPPYRFLRGYIPITSKDVYAALDLDVAYLSHPADVAPHVFGYKKGREIIRRMPCVITEYGPCHPKFPTGSAAACGAVDDQDIEYTAEDDKAIEHWVRNSVDTCFHLLYKLNVWMSLTLWAPVL